MTKLFLFCVPALALAGGMPPREAVERIAGAAVAGGGPYQVVQSLTDKVGARLGGSPGAERAVEWAVDAMKKAGLKNVKKEPVKVPRWVRGAESGEIVAPSPQPLRVTALGGSIGTPDGGVVGEVIEARDFDALRLLGDKAKGKIVFFNKPFRRTRDFEGYGEVVGLRGRGAIEAGRAGAMAMLLRSTGSGYHRLPHTGAMRYDEAVTKVPAAAVSPEDAELLHRLLASGEKVQVKIHLGAKLEGEVGSFNVVGDAPGREKPSEIVVVGAHLDSWDLGTGALDDGAGCGIALEVGRLLLKSPARRTVRVVLYMNEEFGLSGARAYAETHKDEIKRHVGAIEADSGAGRPMGFHVVGGPDHAAKLRAWVLPLAGMMPTDVKTSEMGGADLIPLQAGGVPIYGVQQDVSEYFDWHHTAGDTFDKIDQKDLALASAAYAWLAWAAAEAGEIMPPPPPPPKW